MPYSVMGWSENGLRTTARACTVRMQCVQNSTVCVALYCTVLVSCATEITIPPSAQQWQHQNISSLRCWTPPLARPYSTWCQASTCMKCADAPVLIKLLLYIQIYIYMYLASHIHDEKRFEIEARLFIAKAPLLCTSPTPVVVLHT